MFSGLAVQIDITRKYKYDFLKMEDFVVVVGGKLINKTFKKFFSALFKV